MQRDCRLACRPPHSRTFLATRKPVANDSTAAGSPDLDSGCAIATRIVESSTRLADMSSRSTFGPGGPITAEQMDAIMAHWMGEPTAAISTAIAGQTAAIKDLGDRLFHRIDAALTEEFALSGIANDGMETILRKLGLEECKIEPTNLQGEIHFSRVPKHFKWTGKSEPKHAIEYHASFVQ